MIGLAGFCWSSIWNDFTHYNHESDSYHERASLSAIKVYNAMSWPGGAAIFLCILISIDLRCASLVCALGICIDVEIVTDFWLSSLSGYHYKSVVPATKTKTRNFQEKYFKRNCISQTTVQQKQESKIHFVLFAFRIRIAMLRCTSMSFSGIIWL